MAAAAPFYVGVKAVESMGKAIGGVVPSRARLLAYRYAVASKTRLASPAAGNAAITKATARGDV